MFTYLLILHVGTRVAVAVGGEIKIFTGGKYGECGASSFSI